MNNSPFAPCSRNWMGFCVWLLETTVLFIVWLFTVPVSCACTLSMSALWVEMHTFKRNVEGFSL